MAVTGVVSAIFSVKRAIGAVFLSDEDNVVAIFFACVEYPLAELLGVVFSPSQFSYFSGFRQLNYFASVGAEIGNKTAVFTQKSHTRVADHDDLIDDFTATVLECLGKR